MTLVVDQDVGLEPSKRETSRVVQGFGDIRPSDPRGPYLGHVYSPTPYRRLQAVRVRAVVNKK